MAIITLSNIKKAFGPRELFKDVSFFVNENERAALVGANGTGKTTLLRILCGEESNDDGSVYKQPGATIGYLPQEVDLPEVVPLFLAVVGVTPEILACASELADLQKKLASASEDHAHGLGSRYSEISHKFDNLHGFEYQVKARTVLLGLGFDESDFDKPVRQLSGGQKIRAALARLLILSPDILLLDEPTNHLDIQACEWLQEFLKERYQGAALIVSHDRYFLDQVVHKVVELEDGIMNTYPGNYSAFADQKIAKIEEQRKIYKNQQKEITRIETAIQTLFSDRKFSRRDNKVKQLERIERVSNVRDQKSISVSIGTTVRSGREVIRFSKLSKSYPNKDLFSGANFVVERGQKVGVVGPNGSGKTTLLKIIADRESADSGEVIFGHNVQPVYFAQEFDHLVSTRTVLEELCFDAEISAQQARDLLARFLFMGDDSFKKVEVLSGGEQCRLALAKVLADAPNLLLLDEPTNHLDIASREALEGALREYNGTVLLASHDRYLLDAVCNVIIEIKDGIFTPYPGNYSNYREKIHLQSLAAAAKASASDKQVSDQTDRPMTGLRQLEKQLRDFNKSRKELEENIEIMERRQQELTSALADEENYRNGSVREFTIEYDNLFKQLETAYADWEKFCEVIAETQEQLSAYASTNS